MNPMAHQPDQWVSMELMPHAELSYRTGALGALAGAPAPQGRRVMLRVMFRGPALTDSLMQRLRVFADRLLARGVHASARRVVEGTWNRQTDQSLFFVSEADQRLRAVSAAAAQEVANAWSERWHASTAHPDVIVEFLLHDHRVPLAETWDELRDTLDVGLSAPPVKATTSEPTVVIRTNPAEARRTALLAQGWPTSTEVGQQNGTQSSNPGQWAKDKRDAGQLLGVWDSTRRTFRHPAFQFDGDGHLRGDIKTLLDALANHPDWTATADANGWRRAYWLYQPFRSLSRAALASAGGDQPTDPADPEEERARTPAEVFADHPAAVIALAAQAAAAGQPDTDAEGQPHAD